MARCLPLLATPIEEHAPTVIALCRRLEQTNAGLAALARRDTERYGELPALLYCALLHALLYCALLHALLYCALLHALLYCALLHSLLYCGGVDAGCNHGCPGCNPI